MAEAERVATHAVLFQEGRVIAQGAITDLTGVRKRFRFTSSATINTTELAGAAGSPAHHMGEGVYEIAAESSPRLVGRVTQWLAEQGLPLISIDMGQESLEDAYRRMTGGRR
jgi:ABC-type multidrug transport system ATPase subunit